MGVVVDGERLNYSNEIIETLGAEDFVLVSIGVAETGFENGAYGAIVKFPADVSEKILTFNSQRPERVQLEFQVNKNLTEQNFIDTNLKIMNLQVSINTTLAYTYVASIYRQFHNAQDHLEFVFRNNMESLQSMDTIRLPAFSSGLDLDELPEILLETEGVDTAQHKDMVSGFAEMVSGVYLSSYEAASQTYLFMREGMFELIDVLPDQENDWIGKMIAWATVKIEYSDEVSLFTQDLEEYSDKLQEWLDNVYVWYGDAGIWHTHHKLTYDETKEYIDEVFAYVELLENEIEPVLLRLQELYDMLEPSLEMLNEWHDEMEPFFNKLHEWYGEIGTAIDDIEGWLSDLEGWEGYVASDMNTLNIYQIDLNTAQGYLANWYSGLSASSAQCAGCITCTLPPPLQPLELSIPSLPIGFKITDLPEELDIILPDLDDDFPLPELNDEYEPPGADEFKVPAFDDLIDEMPDGDIPELPDKIELREPPDNTTPAFTEPAPERPTELQPPRPDDFWASVSFMHNQLSEFDVDEFLSDDVHGMVLGFLSSFDDFLGFLSDDMDMQFDLNLMELDRVRFGYIEYLAGLKADTLQGEADEQERLRGDLDEIIGINESNHDNTHGRLSEFAGMMPESRTQAGMNRDLVDFTVAPFEFVRPEVRQAMLAADTVQESSDDGMPVLDIVIISVAVLLLLLIGVAIVSLFRKRKNEE